MRRPATTSGVSCGVPTRHLSAPAASVKSILPAAGDMGAGAVSRWRLELGGPPGSYDVRNLTDVTITLKYTALQGGDAFAAGVRGLLKPTDLPRAFNLSVDFADAWQAFLQSDSSVLQLPLSQALFPNMLSGGTRAIFTRYEYGSTDSSAPPFFILDMGQQITLADGKTVDTSGLSDEFWQAEKNNPERRTV
jgi:hypothetical protein